MGIIYPQIDVGFYWPKSEDLDITRVSLNRLTENEQRCYRYDPKFKTSPWMSENIIYKDSNMGFYLH